MRYYVVFIFLVYSFVFHKTSNPSDKSDLRAQVNVSFDRGAICTKCKVSFWQAAVIAENFVKKSHLNDQVESEFRSYSIHGESWVFFFNFVDFNNSFPVDIAVKVNMFNGKTEWMYLQ